MSAFIALIMEVLSINLDLGGFSVNLGGLALGYLLLSQGVNMLEGIKDVDDQEHNDDVMDEFMNDAWEADKAAKTSSGIDWVMEGDNTDPAYYEYHAELVEDMDRP